MQQVKAVERLTIAASANRDQTLAWRAIAAHPLVDSVGVARRLFETYRSEIPGVGAAFE